MKTLGYAATIGLLVAGMMIGSASAQQGFRRPGGPTGGGTGGGTGQTGGGNNRKDEKRDVTLPDDPVLLELHKTFVLAAEKLAADYERKGQPDKARACYSEILRLVPTYTPAAEKLTVIQQKEAIAEHKTFEVMANKGWQDAGIGVIAGKPLSVKATGTWTIKMTYSLSADGIEIPKELRDFPLGALVGKIATSPTDEDAKIFLIGAAKSFTADKDGRLYLRIYDGETDDNLGKISTYIEGTYKK